MITVKTVVKYSELKDTTVLSNDKEKLEKIKKTSENFALLFVREVYILANQK